MAEMIKIDLERERAGGEIVSLTDQLGMGVQAAFWLHNQEVGTWQYHLITPLVDQKGPRWVYERLLKVFQKVNPPAGITPLDIFVMGPAWNVFRTMLITGEPDRCGMTFRQNSAEGSDVSVAHVYRLRKDGIAQAANFDIKVRQLLAA